MQLMTRRSKAPLLGTTARWSIPQKTDLER